MESVRSPKETDHGVRQTYSLVKLTAAHESAQRYAKAMEEQRPAVRFTFVFMSTLSGLAALALVAKFFEV
jgi:hypothetical protein